jgi:hypothetical protein
VNLFVNVQGDKEPHNTKQSFQAKQPETNHELARS